MVADRAKAMFELGDGADLQPRINTSTLPHHSPHNLPRDTAQKASNNPCFNSYTPLLLHTHHVSGLLRTAACAVAAASSPRSAACLDRPYDALTTPTIRSTDP